jgi:hypothetical protein
MTAIRVSTIVDHTIRSSGTESDELNGIKIFALVMYVVGGEPSCDFLDTEGQTWPDQIAAVTG